MIGDPLELDPEGAQRVAARRTFRAGKPFEELAIGRRVTGRGVAGNCLRKIQAAPVRSAAQCPFDAAVLVAERDLQMDHPLAMAVEAEMAGLDDPGMHRTDRNLVDLGAGDREELSLADRRAARRETHWFQPRMSLRLDAVLFVDLALEVMRRRAIRRQRRVGAGDKRRTA